MIRLLIALAALAALAPLTALDRSGDAYQWFGHHPCPLTIHAPNYQGQGSTTIDACAPHYDARRTYVDLTVQLRQPGRCDGMWWSLDDGQSWFCVPYEGRRNRPVGSYNNPQTFEQGLYRKGATE